MKLLSPVVELCYDVRIRAPAPLPVCKVGEVDREWRQRRFLSGRESVVEGGKLVDEHTEGPAVLDGHVHGNEQEVCVLGQAHGACSNERPTIKVEGLEHLVSNELAGDG